MAQEESNLFNRVTIVGPGLLGASIGMAIQEKGIAKEIWAHLRNEKKRQVCNNSIWCKKALTNLKDAVKQSDLVVVCTPVDNIIEQLPNLSEWVKPGCLVTDVGSLKQDICLLARKSFLNKKAYFVGSHPMCGSEKEGMKYATPKIFEQKHCIITPMGGENKDNYQKIVSFWNSLGLKVTQLTPEIHDQIVGSISHLPHIIATTLINTLDQKNENWMSLSGNGLKDTTRIASGNASMWGKILLGNKDHLILDIEQMIQKLNEFKEVLTLGDEKKLFALLASAKKRRDQLNDS